jgi:hypothetical protein
MTDLFVADLQRLVWRRSARALGLATLIVIAAAGVIVFWTSGNNPFDPLTGLRVASGTAAAALALAGFVVGAWSFGADEASRALTTLLTWEPRRPRVLASRAAACAAFIGCVTLAALALLCAALLPAALAHSTGAAPAGDWYGAMATLWLRCALLAACAAAIGVSCASIGRGTLAALALAAVYLIGIERAAFAFVPSLSRWLFLTDAQSWLAVDPRSGLAARGGGASGHSVVAAGLLLLAVVLALHALATWMLTRQDIP